MNDEIGKDLFKEAVEEGLRRASEINSKIRDIINLVDAASYSVNRVHSDVKISSSIEDSSRYTNIVAFVVYKDNLESRKLMTFEILKDSYGEIIVTSRKGKTTCNNIEELTALFAEILSAPTFWTGIEEMKKRV